MQPYCVKCNKFRKLANPKMSDIFDKILVLFIVSTKCSNNEEKIFKVK